MLQFQYSKRVEFCASIAGKSRDEVFKVFKAIALTVTPVDYGAFYLKNASFAMYFLVDSARTEEEPEPGSIKAAQSSVTSKHTPTTLCDHFNWTSISISPGARTSLEPECGRSSTG